MKNIPIEELWSDACSGDIEALQEYYRAGGELNRRYNKFNKDHSLIMGAARNGYFKTVQYLYNEGETIDNTEEKEFMYNIFMHCIDLGVIDIGEVIKRYLPLLCDKE